MTNIIKKLHAIDLHTRDMAAQTKTQTFLCIEIQVLTKTCTEYVNCSVQPETLSFICMMRSYTEGTMIVCPFSYCGDSYGEECHLIWLKLQIFLMSLEACTCK